MVIWFLSGMEREPRRGEITRSSNIDETQVYHDIIDQDGNQHHVLSSMVFDHCPQLVEVEDDFGKFTQWA